MKLAVREKSNFITAVPAVQVFVFSNCILIKERGGFSLQESIRSVGPPTLQYNLTSPQRLSRFLLFNVFQEEGRMCLIIDQILLWNQKCKWLLHDLKKDVLPEPFSC